MAPPRPRSNYAFIGLALTLALVSSTRDLASQQPPAEPVTAIVGATLIDGTGGPARPDTTIIIKGQRIATVGPRSSATVPDGATVIDGAGRFVTPGFIDTNVHVSLYGGGETLVRYQPRITDLVLEAAQLHLKHGITTIRDSYGQLAALKTVRDAIKRGEMIGPRMLVAGNIVGWGGPGSVSFGGGGTAPTLFEQQMRDLIVQGAGEELFDMTPAQVRAAITQYLDKGPDFIKYGGTSHSPSPAFIALSPESQRTIVEETHKRGLLAETHSTTPEAMRVSVLAGVDLIQHPESMAGYEMPDDLVKLIVERKVICAILENKLGGPYWKKHLKDVEAAKKKQAEADKEATEHSKKIPKTAYELRQEERARGRDNEVRRVNALKLINAGAIVSIATDNYLGSAPEFRRTPKDAFQEPGLGTIIAIESLVEVGVPPATAISMATLNGARAARLEQDLGTIEAGKLADLLVLDADPLASIANIRKLRTVMKDGRVVDVVSLPTNPVFSKPTPPPTFAAQPRDREPIGPGGAGAVTAIVGVTVIDGTGAPAVPDATVLITGERITAVGPRASVTVPAGATIVDGTGKYLTPGLIDTNVHVSMYGAGETAVRYQPRAVEVTLEAAQLHLKYGVTTIRDSYGQLGATKTVRDLVARGEVAGPRMLVAGNIVGWGGPGSRSFSGAAASAPSLFEEQLQDLITLGSGEDLIDMAPAEVRVAINKYLDKGPDFIKFGGTTHTTSPSFIDFSPEAQQAIVEETHKRGLVAETHSTNSEGLRLSVLAGIDLIQHPEALGARELPDDLVTLIVQRRVINAILSNKFTGEVWKKHLKAQADRKKTEGEQKEGEKKEGAAQAKRAKTETELRAERRATGIDLIMRRVNAQKLIKAGAIIAVSTDNIVGSAPELSRQPVPPNLTPGLGTIIALEGLVEIGMTPLEAIKAATLVGAQACRLEKDLGTVQPGKIADLVLLDANPLDDIANIRKLRMVMKDGRVIAVGKLPTNPVLHRPAVPSATY